MTDEERFRNAVIFGTSHPEMYKTPEEEIERLRAENEKLRAENETHKEIAVRETMNVATLRAALKRIAEQDAVEMALDPQWARRAAAAALKEK